MHLITLIAAFYFSLARAAPFGNESCTTEDDFTVGQTIETSSGPVTGDASTKFPDVSVYLGIPFGQAPVGGLRFAAPVKFVGSSPINGSSFVSCQNMSDLIAKVDVSQGEHMPPTPKRRWLCSNTRSNRILQCNSCRFRASRYHWGCQNDKRRLSVSEYLDKTSVWGRKEGCYDLHLWWRVLKRVICNQRLRRLYTR